MESRQENYRMQKTEYRKPQEIEARSDNYRRRKTGSQYGTETRSLQNAKMNSGEFQSKILNNKIRI